MLFMLIPGCPALAETVEPIRFTADKVEYTYREGAEKVKCMGNARIERSDFFLKANTVIILGKDRNQAKAYDNVRIINRQNQIVIEGHYAEYNNTNSYMKVFKSPRLISTNKRVTITSAVMESFLSEDRSVATGSVRIVQTNYTADAEKAEYFQGLDQIELTGDPVVYSGSDTFQARKIIIYVKQKLVKMFNDVYAVIKPGQEKK